MAWSIRTALGALAWMTVGLVALGFGGNLHAKAAPAGAIYFLRQDPNTGRGQIFESFRASRTGGIKRLLRKKIEISLEEGLPPAFIEGSAAVLREGNSLRRLDLETGQVKMVLALPEDQGFLLRRQVDGMITLEIYDEVSAEGYSPAQRKARGLWPLGTYSYDFNAAGARAVRQMPMEDNAGLRRSDRAGKKTVTLERLKDEHVLLLDEGDGRPARELYRSGALELSFHSVARSGDVMVLVASRHFGDLGLWGAPLGWIFERGYSRFFRLDLRSGALTALSRFQVIRYFDADQPALDLSPSGEHFLLRKPGRLFLDGKRIATSARWPRGSWVDDDTVLVEGDQGEKWLLDRESKATIHTYEGRTALAIDPTVPPAIRPAKAEPSDGDVERSFKYHLEVGEIHTASAGAEASLCEGFKLNEEQVRAFFSNANLVNKRVIHDDFDTFPCLVFGSLTTGEEKIEWMINAGLYGELIYPDKRKISFGCYEGCKDAVLSVGER